MVDIKNKIFSNAGITIQDSHWILNHKNFITETTVKHNRDFYEEANEY